jgi:hypothetical protein
MGLGGFNLSNFKSQPIKVSGLDNIKRVINPAFFRKAFPSISENLAP